MAKSKKKKKKIDSEEYIRINKSINRLEELERNGWRWIAKDRPHKNKKKYDRKRDRKVDFLSLNCLIMKHKLSIDVQCWVSISIVC